MFIKKTSRSLAKLLINTLTYFGVLQSHYIHILREILRPPITKKKKIYSISHNPHHNYITTILRTHSYLPYTSQTVSQELNNGLHQRPANEK
jgi:hypothetical protein